MPSRSVLSLLQSFDSAIQQGVLSMLDEPEESRSSPNETDNDDSTSSNSLYSVISQPFLTLLTL